MSSTDDIHLTQRALAWLRGQAVSRKGIAMVACAEVGQTPTPPEKGRRWCRAEDVRALVYKWKHAYVWRTAGLEKRYVTLPTCPFCVAIMDPALAASPRHLEYVKTPKNDHVPLKKDPETGEVKTEIILRIPRSQREEQP